jgi:hypothetical protein
MIYRGLVLPIRNFSRMYSSSSEASLLALKSVLLHRLTSLMRLLRPKQGRPYSERPSFNLIVWCSQPAFAATRIALKSSEWTPASYNDQPPACSINRRPPALITLSFAAEALRLPWNLSAPHHTAKCSELSTPEPVENGNVSLS